MTDQNLINKNLDMKIEYSVKSYEFEKSDHNKNQSEPQDLNEISTRHSISIESKVSIVCMDKIILK